MLRKILLFAAFVLLSAAGAFLFQNMEPVDVSFLLWGVSVSKGLLVFGAFGLGLLAGIFISAGFYLAMKKQPNLSDGAS
jgi:uncharacterized integral membrane protein